MNSPKVTVLMPVYNGERFLREAIDSILRQEYAVFEFLIMNDGSSDGSEKIIASYTDPRIRLVNNEKNLGLIATLNKGIDLAKGEYIVRMDCDDVSLKNRIAKQVEFMEGNKNIGVCGSFYYLLLNGKKALVDFPVTPEEIRCHMVFNCPIAHPSSIIRRQVLTEHNLKYRNGFIHSEDWDLWTQLSEFAGIANIPEPLLNYRVHGNQITGNEALAENRLKSVGSIRTRHLQAMGVEPSEKELVIHNLISDGRRPADPEQLNEAEAWLKKLCKAADQYKKVDKACFEKMVLERWLRMCFNYYGGAKGLGYFYRSSLNKSISLPLKAKLSFINNLYYSWKRLKIK
jgi:glycosyltransferase involved in cell wall biosynthesis